MQAAEVSYRAGAHGYAKLDVHSYLDHFPHCQKASNIRTIKCRKRCAMNYQQNKIRYTLFGNICMSLITIRVYKLYEFNA